MILSTWDQLCVRKGVGRCRDVRKGVRRCMKVRESLVRCGDVRKGEGRCLGELKKKKSSILNGKISRFEFF